MKRIKPFILLLTGLLLIQASCEPQASPPKPIAEIDKLPPATQTGANTFGCLVNGKAWVTRTSLDATASSQLSDYLEVKAKKGHQFINILLLGDILDGIEYDIGSNSVSEVEFILDGCSFESNDIITGSVKLTKLDRAALIASGTFLFSGYTSGCDSLIVTNGRFDLTLIQ